MKKTCSGGFTLIELMVSITVLAVLLGLAAPSFQSFIRTSKVASLTNDLVSALNLARSEAIKRGTNVTVCKVADPNTSTPACSTGANWQDGWLVFTDGSTAGTVDGSDVRIRVGQPSSSGASITADSNFSNYITYNSRGGSKGNGGASSGNVVVCLGGVARTININTTGRIQLSSGAC